MATQARPGRSNLKKAPPQSRPRRRPGSTGQGRYYHIAVLPKRDFVFFRTQDVGRKGHIQRVAGRRASGSWSTVKWLISKDDAHVRAGRLVPDTANAKQVLAQLGSAPQHVSGDRYKARPRPNVPERLKPTRAQKRARSRNIKRAQAARRA